MSIDILGRGISVGYDEWSCMWKLAEENGWHGSVKCECSSDESGDYTYFSKETARDWGHYLLKAYNAAMDADSFDDSVSENWKNVYPSRVLMFVTDVLLKGDGFTRD